ncbi:MAG: MarR family transcriptional regulator [Ignavibacteriaceae bacterium]|nr:MarR family transcriptional regulator [Ignavibacteriaceae bacterium]
MKLEDEILQKHFRNEYHKATVNVIYSYNWLVDFQVNLFKPYGITMQQYNILRILRGQYPKPATIKLIKERMLDKMSDASRIVEKLRIKGLVDRNICSGDRRNVDVCITDKGLELLSRVDKHDAEVDAKLSTLSEDEAKQLNELLDKLRG